MLKSNNTAIILVSPQMGENIGAAARVMKNFGLDDLRIVSPRDGWPNEKADSMAAGAIDLIKSAKIYDSLAASIADLEYLYATTGVARDMNKDYISAKNLNSLTIAGTKTGIMFGRENWGLNNEEISLANKIITIETAPDFSSLNIAQAIAVICHELFKSPPRPDLSNKQNLCTKEELEYFFEHLCTELEKKDFFKVAEKKPQMIKNIKNIFTRLEKLSKTEVTTLRGIINALTKRESK